jgi:hypothetical protein
MTHHIHDRQSTEAQFFAEYDKLKSDYAESQMQVLVLTDQVRELTGINSNLKFQTDFLTAEVARVTASREQYERVGIRASAMLEAGTTMVMKLLEDLQEEIRIAAFAKVPGSVAAQPEGLEEGEKPLFLEGDDQTPIFIDQFGLPPNRFGNGAGRT